MIRYSDLAAGSFFSLNGSLVDVIVQQYELTGDRDNPAWKRIPKFDPNTGERRVDRIIVKGSVQTSTATIGERTDSGIRTTAQVRIVTKENPYQDRVFNEKKTGIRVVIPYGGRAREYWIREVNIRQSYIEALGVHAPRA